MLVIGDIVAIPEGGFSAEDEIEDDKDAEDEMEKGEEKEEEGELDMEKIKVEEIEGEDIEEEMEIEDVVIEDEEMDEVEDIEGEEMNDDDIEEGRNDGGEIEEGEIDEEINNDDEEMEYEALEERSAEVGVEHVVEAHVSARGHVDEDLVEEPQILRRSQRRRIPRIMNVDIPRPARRGVSRRRHRVRTADLARGYLRNGVSSRARRMAIATIRARVRAQENVREEVVPEVRQVLVLERSRPVTRSVTRNQARDAVPRTRIDAIERSRRLRLRRTAHESQVDARRRRAAIRRASLSRHVTRSDEMSRRARRQQDMRLRELNRRIQSRNRRCRLAAGYGQLASHAISAAIGSIGERSDSDIMQLDDETFAENLMDYLFSSMNGLLSG